MGMELEVRMTDWLDMEADVNDATQIAIDDQQYRAQTEYDLQGAVEYYLQVHSFKELIKFIAENF